MSNTSDMKDAFKFIPKDAGIVVDESKSQISVLDAAKIPYFHATRNLDRVLVKRVDDVNDTLEAVKTEYQNRIDVQGCRSDLFWRLTGITTTGVGGGLPGVGSTVFNFTATKLAPTYPLTSGAAGLGTEAYDNTTGVGISTDAVTIWNGNLGFTSITMNVQGDSLISAGSGMDAFFEPDNLHGIKRYNEPYARDVFDTFRSVGVGTIGIGTDFMTILKPANTIDIKVGYLMTPQVSGFFASKFVSVIGVGTTAVDLSSYPVSGIQTTDTKSVPLIQLSEQPIGIISAPMSDGNYVEMVFTQDPDTISDSFAVSEADNPYVDQVIDIMKRSNAGTGVSIKYNNSGENSDTKSWNKFYDGFPDPDDLQVDDDGRIINIVREPSVGAGKIFYSVGFPQQPVIGGVPATEGQQLDVDETVLSGTAGYQTLPSCDDDALDTAIIERNIAEDALAADTDFTGMLDTSNQVKQKISDEFNLRIWAYRLQIGQAQKRSSAFISFDELIENSPYADIMDQD